MKLVNVGDMFYVQAADSDLRVNGECGGAVTAILKYLLEKKIVDAALAMRQGADLYDGVPTLVTDPSKITEFSGSLHCAPIMQSTVLVKYLNGAKGMKVAVVGVGCDCWAIQKLSEKGVISKENLVLIGLNCGGTFPPVQAQEMIKKFYGINPMDVTNEEIAKGSLILETNNHQTKGLKIDNLEEKGYGRRSNCRRCEVKIPRMADLACGSWGVVGPDVGTATFIEVCTKAGAQLLEDAIRDSALTSKSPIPEGIELREKTEQTMLKLSAQWQARDFLAPEAKNEFWLKQFAKCIKCLGCVNACPVCVCDECKLESKEPLWFESGELPPSPKLQFTRAAHMANDCVNCGQCEDACPVDIPLSTFFQQSSKEFGALFARFDELTSM